MAVCYKNSVAGGGCNHCHASCYSDECNFPWQDYNAKVQENIQLKIQLCERQEQLRKRQEQLREREEQIEKLEQQVAKLSKNSRNSSKPPSSDIVKPNGDKNHGANKRKKRKRGGQPGHSKHQRPAFTAEELTATYDYTLNCCPDCQGHLILCPHNSKTVQQININLNNIAVEKEEHRSFTYWCDGCQKYHQSSIPLAVKRGGLSGIEVTALVAYLKCVLHASHRTIQRFFRDFFQLKYSTGYINKLLKKVSDSLEQTYHELLKALPGQKSVNVDETGHKENGNRLWTWCFRAEMFVLFKISPSRSSDNLIAILGNHFDGVLGCDYFSAYRKYMRLFDIRVQFCLAHLIRDLKYLAGLKQADSKAYGARILKATAALFKIIHRRDKMTAENFQKALEEARNKIIKAATENIPSKLNKAGKEIYTEVKNMAKRFVKHGKAYFEFITTPEIEPTNNIAEQAIRFVVIDRLITQGTRSEKGRQFCERIWTVVATCTLQCRNVMDFLIQAVEAYFNNDPAPSLLEPQPP